MYEAVYPSSKYHSDKCRVEAGRARKQGLPVSIATVVGMPAPESSAPSGLVAATARQLEAVDRLDSPHGQAALVLAQRIESGHEHGSAVAALTRELRSTLEAALEGVRPAADAVDELRLRREHRRSG
jgi:hypothetical protein